jgi:hypothetical protein
MKTIISLFVASLITITVYSQDSAKMRQIDALVSLINNSNFKVQRDSIIQDLPEYGISMRTYLTAVIDGTELKKYVNNVHSTTQENGVSKQMVGENAFYFDHNKLIKVEEYGKQDDKKIEMLWYYEDDKPIYYTLKSDKAKDRAEQLLGMAKIILEKMKF